jgi:hypothetical protein
MEKYATTGLELPGLEFPTMRSRDAQVLLPAPAPCTSTSIRNSVMAGYVAGITGTLVGYPLDSAKVWLQTKRQPIPAVSSCAAANALAIAVSPTSPRFIGNRAASTLASAIQTNVSSQNAFRTIRSLYKGVACPLVTVGLVQSANFAIYDSTRRMLYALDNRATCSLSGNSNSNSNDSNYLHHDSLFHVGVASMTAGAVLALITSPLVMIKTKQQVQQISFLQASRQTFFSRTNAWCWRTAYRGLGPHFVAETVGRAIYFVAYERCKRQLSSADRPLSLSARMGSAALSGMVCWTLIFPLDVLRNRLYAATTAENAWTMSQHIYREHGVKGFFRGYAISVVRAGPVAAMILPVYDHVLDMLQTTSL